MQQLCTAREKHLSTDAIYMPAQNIANKLDPCFEGSYHIIGIEHCNKMKKRHLKNLSVKIVLLDQLKQVSYCMDSREELPPLLPPEPTTNHCHPHLNDEMNILKAVFVIFFLIHS